MDCEIAVIVGGGNIWRGKTGSDLGMDRGTADYMMMIGLIPKPFSPASASPLSFSTTRLYLEVCAIIYPIIIKSVAKQVAEVAKMDCEIAVIVGGGNIWRGA
jgi:uridylate kinase